MAQEGLLSTTKAEAKNVQAALEQGEALSFQGALLVTEIHRLQTGLRGLGAKTSTPRLLALAQSIHASEQTLIKALEKLDHSLLNIHQTE